MAAIPSGSFYLELNNRYSGPLTEPPPDKSDRVDPRRASDWVQ